jgi:hypothetical protein
MTRVAMFDGDTQRNKYTVPMPYNVTSELVSKLGMFDIEFGSWPGLVWLFQGYLCDLF